MKADKPVRPEFNVARNWIAEQTQQLTDNQRSLYEQMRSRHNDELTKKLNNTEKIRKRLHDALNVQRDKPPTLSFKPPFLVKTPNPVPRLSYELKQHDAKYRKLHAKYKNEQIEFLEKARQQREYGMTSSATLSWTQAALLYRSQIAGEQSYRNPPSLLHRSNSNRSQDRDTPDRLRRSRPEEGKERPNSGARDDDRSR